MAPMGLWLRHRGLCLCLHAALSLCESASSLPVGGITSRTGVIRAPPPVTSCSLDYLPL